MEKGLLRLSKRILILLLCTCLISGSVIQRYKITANASSIVLGGVTYSIGEVLAWLGVTVAGITGTAYVASDDYSKLIELGYETAKAMDAELDNAQDWLFATMDKDGKAYFYANNYFDAIQSCDIGSILETSVELSNDFAIFATDTLWDILYDFAADVEAKILADEENVLTDVIPIPEYSYSGSVVGVRKLLVYECYYDEFYKSYIEFSGDKRVCGYLSSSNSIVAYSLSNSGSLIHASGDGSVYTRRSSEQEWSYKWGTSDGWLGCSLGYYANFPIFTSEAACLQYLQTGEDSGCINKTNVYQIADWSDSPQHGDFRDVITQNPALVNDYVSGMSNAFGVSVDEQIVAGEYPDVIDTSLGAIPFDKPDVITPSYVGALDVPWAPDLPAVDYPGLANPDLPWSNVWTDAGVGDTDVPVTDGSGTEEEPPSDEEIRGKDPSGIQLLFGTLFDLIMILLMLLMIFLSCLAFIVMIFRIEPTTGFLPEEMIAGIDYIKTLQIPGFGMSVYDFFMALIYIILIFTVIGILRKNIDKLKFPRKGKW